MGQVSGDFHVPRMARALDLRFYVCLFIGRKVTMDFISLTFRLVIKCQILSELSKPTTICSCCFSESRDSSAVSLLSSPCLLHPSLLSAHYGRELLGQQPLSGTLSPRTDNHGLPWKHGPGFESVVSLFGLARLALPSPALEQAFEQAGRQPWPLHTAVRSSREGEFCGAATYPPTPDPSWLRNTHPPGSLKCRVLSCSFYNGRE